MLSLTTTATKTGRADDRASLPGPVVADLRANGATSLREIAAGLNQRGFPAAKGGAWSAMQVQSVLARLEGGRAPALLQARAADGHQSVLTVIMRRSEANREREKRERWRLDFETADLDGANLHGARLDGADLGGARLEKADLGVARLEGAIGLTQDQLESAAGDAGTTLRSGLIRDPVDQCGGDRGRSGAAGASCRADQPDPV